MFDTDKEGTETEEKFCGYYKFLLVEDLSMCNDMTKMHYGYCSVIGRIVCQNQRFYMESTQLTAFKLDLRVPDGHTSVLLLPQLCEKPLAVNDWVECFGEALIWNNKSNVSLNSKILNAHKREIDNADDQSKYDFNLSDLEPAIRIHNFNVIDQPHSLINTNLAIRQVRSKLKPI